MKKPLTDAQKDEFLKLLKNRFDKNKHRHPNLDWQNIQTKLNSECEKLKSLFAMELSGGEPDVIEFSTKNNEFIFIDCSKESPIGRRSLCYDKEALASRKQHKPAGSAMEMAKKMGVDILTESEYRELQKFEKFDTKTSSWIQTPNEIRQLDGALFCDYRYETVFLYHNGAESYYAARGFRAKIVI